VLINDIVGRRVLLFDSALTLVTVVADTTSATASAYGTRPGGLIAFHGDSTLFVDPGSLSMLLIDPSGKIARVMSAPRAQDIGFLVGGPFGAPGFDPSGKLVYRAPPNFQALFRAPAANGLPPAPQVPESAAIVRFDLASRKLDTATFFKTPKIVMNVTRTPDGGVRVLPFMNPLPQGDDWALLPDGTIALVRTRDFHIDWLASNGTLSSSPKIPFPWERLTDSGKVAFIDSSRVAIEKLRASGQFGFGGGPGGPGGMTFERQLLTKSDSKNTKKEDLGKQTIEGVEAVGTRFTTTIAAGEVGNEQPISVVFEKWYSEELQTVVMTRSTDPRFGENTYRLTNINRGEPAHSLFEVPADYTLKETVPDIRYKIDSEVRRPGAQN
jgi:hypothetical protein